MRHTVTGVMGVGRMIALCSIALQAAPALAQQIVLPLPEGPGYGSRYTSANAGGLLETGPMGGGATVNPPMAGETPSFRPLGSAIGEVTSTLEGEAWSGQGDRVESGTRVSLLNNYTHGLGQDCEVAVTVPFEWVNYFGGYTGFGDTEVAVRKYLYDPNKAGGTTIVVSGKLYLPTGEISHSTGIGRFSGGPSVMAAHPFGSRSQGYAGIGYNVVGQPTGYDLHNVLYYWAGGVTGLNTRWTAQYEVEHYISVFNEGWTRATVDMSRRLSPTSCLRLSIKQELQADGHATTLGVGYSSR